MYDTPIPHKPLLSWFGHDALTQDAAKVVEGKFIFPPFIHPDVIEFADFLEMGEEIKDAPEIDITSSPINFNNFWRQGREKNIFIYVAYT